MRKKIILLESNVSLASELKAALEVSGEISVVYMTDDGDEGMNRILIENPDLVIVGMFLKGLDGCAVIREMKKKGLKGKVVATGLPSDTVIARAMDEGADYYIVKPFSILSATSTVYSLLEEKKSETDGREYQGTKKKSVSTDEKISEIFISIGIPPHIKGYGYLREGIKTTVEKPYIINNVTKELYPSIAQKFDTSPSKVERAIRHAIEVAWNRGRVDAINAIFGTRVYLGTEKPTNSEFIALIADKLILENML